MNQCFEAVIDVNPTENSTSAQIENTKPQGGLCSKAASHQILRAQGENEISLLNDVGRTKHKILQ